MRARPWWVAYGVFAAGGPKYGDVSARELERWLTREGLAEVRDGQVHATAKAVELVDMLWPEYHGDARRRATWLG